MIKCLSVDRRVGCSMRDASAAGARSERSKARAQRASVHPPTAISPFLSGLSRSLSVLRRLVPLLLARLRLRQTCYVITVGAHSGKFSVSSRVAATLCPRPSQRSRQLRTVRLWHTNSDKFMNYVLKFVWTHVTLDPDSAEKIALWRYVIYFDVKKSKRFFYFEIP